MSDFDTEYKQLTRLIMYSFQATTISDQLVWSNRIDLQRVKIIQLVNQNSEFNPSQRHFLMKLIGRI